jgi:hypothetical protein
LKQKLKKIIWVLLAPYALGALELKARDYFIGINSLKVVYRAASLQAESQLFEKDVWSLFLSIDYSKLTTYNMNNQSISQGNFTLATGVRYYMSALDSLKGPFTSQKVNKALSHTIKTFQVLPLTWATVF